MRKPEEIATAFASRESLDEKSHFFLVGIGGAGMSALARLLAQRGYTVAGSDSTPSPEVDRLREEGIAVQIGHQPIEYAIGAAVILSDAIDLERSPEVASAREQGMPILRRSQLLGWLLRDKKVIAVTGTHGKTTTTGMTGAGLIAAGIDPLVVAGASIPQWKGPVWYGNGEWAVVEACEAYDALHDIDPFIVVLTNLELDHVDFHGNYENLRNSVLRFVRKIPPDGCLVYCEEDEGAREIAEMAGVRAISYGAHDFLEVAGGARPMQRGEHNVLNAAAALVAALQTGADPAIAIPGIIDFRGAERRQQVLLDDERCIVVIDDYAHHPTEIAASLTAIRDGWMGSEVKGRLVVVFQPHLYSRTEPLIREFAEALDVADLVVLTDIYPAREAPMPGVSSARIAEQVSKPVVYIPSRHLLARKVAKLARPGDVVVGMGAGNISEFAPTLIRELDRLTQRPRKVIVLYAGDSAEREVSIHSGRAVFAALQSRGYEATLVDMTELLYGKPDPNTFAGAQSDRFRKRADLSALTGIDRPDVVFLAVHGTHAEDGAIQGLLELLHIPYTGSGIQASAIAMDKAMTKKVLQAAGISVPRGAHITDMDVPFGLKPPLIVKPNSQGSTVGLTFVKEMSCLCPALADAFSYDTSILIEEWITGTEISVPVLNGEALPPVEIAPDSGFYDFASKYLPGATLEIIPARLPENVLTEAQGIALACHRTLGCEGATRTDMIVRNPESDRPEIFVLEVNTLPGMTATSLLPNSAAAAGIPFDELCVRLIEDALARATS